MLNGGLFMVPSLHQQDTDSAYCLGYSPRSKYLPNVTCILVQASYMTAIFYQSIQTVWEHTDPNTNRGSINAICDVCHAVCVMRERCALKKNLYILCVVYFNMSRLLPMERCCRKASLSWTVVSLLPLLWLWYRISSASTSSSGSTK